MRMFWCPCELRNWHIWLVVFLTCCRCWRGPQSAGTVRSSCSLYWVTATTQTQQGKRSVYGKHCKYQIYFLFKGHQCKVRINKIIALSCNKFSQDKHHMPANSLILFFPAISLTWRPWRESCPVPRGRRRKLWSFAVVWPNVQISEKTHTDERRCSGVEGLTSGYTPLVSHTLTLRWKQATMGSFFMVSCLVDSW